jgi:Dyp-type peroxidase family
MVNHLQRGIYYGPNEQPGNSYCSIFLRVAHNNTAEDVGNVLAQLWKTLKDLELGSVMGISIPSRKLNSGNLSTMLGFTPNIFSLEGVQEKVPTLLKEWSLSPPNTVGGGPIFEGLKLSYGPTVNRNHILDDHIVIQLIADSEFYTFRALNEICRQLRGLDKLTAPHKILKMTGFYPGFRRSDGRSWLGFHDGVSNMRSTERFSAIAISGKKVKGDDIWTANGTYMAYARIAINLSAWDEIDIEKQEVIIGRDKQTGCPLVGIDQYGKVVKPKSCPIPGSVDILDPGNEKFRDHPPYGFQNLAPGLSDKDLESSHIGATNRIYGKSRNDPTARIYRQGFEFIEPSNNSHGLKVGLNFVSFQWSPGNFFNALKYPSIKRFGLNPDQHIPYLEDFLSVESAGILLVPPIVNENLFPGASIFLDAKNIQSILLT